MQPIYCSSCNQSCDLIKYQTDEYTYFPENVIRSKCCNDYVKDYNGNILPYESLIYIYNFQQSFEVSDG